MARILIADADVPLMTRYHRELTSRGFFVALARDGLECLEQLVSCQPEVVVMDPDIPWGGGEGVLEILASEVLLPDISVILVGQRLDLRCDHRVSELIEGRYGKPVSPAELTAIVLNQVKKRNEQIIWAPWSVGDWGIQ